MADNKIHVFKNSLLEHKYDLARNVVEGVTPTSAELQVTLNTISLWRKHIEVQILGISCRQYSLGISQSCKSWFREVENIFQNKDDSVKLIAPLIGNQILRLLEILGELGCFLNPADLIYFLKNLKPSSYATVDCIKAATFLVESTKLEVANKYSIACYFCLKGIIIDFLKKGLPIEFTPKNSFRSEMFWTYVLSGNIKLFNEALKSQLEVDDDAREHLLLWAIRNQNQLAVQYYWDTICNKSPISDVKKFVTYALEFSSCNIVCFLLSKIKENEQIKELCVENGYAVLKKLGNDLRWNDYFKTAEKHVLQFISEMDFKNSLKTLVFCWQKNESEKDRFRALFIDFSAKFNVAVKINFVLNCSFVLKILLAVDDEKIAKKLLTIESIQEIRVILDALCLELIYENYFKIFVEIITDILFIEEAEHFKKRFLGNYNSDIFGYLIADNQFDTLDEFLMYFYCDKEICSKIKEELPYKDQGMLVADMLEISLPSIESEENIERFLIWCFEGDLEKKENCHYALFDIRTTSTQYKYCSTKLGAFMKNLMDSKKLEQLCGFLTWAYPDGNISPTNKSTCDDLIKKLKTMSIVVKSSPE